MIEDKTTDTSAQPEAQNQTKGKRGRYGIC